MSASPTAIPADIAAAASLLPTTQREYPRVDLAALPNPCAHVVAAPITPLQFAEPRRAVNFQDGWDYFRRIGSPRHICAPMVNQSELAFRLLCRKYNTTLCYTPMFHAGLFGAGEQYRAEHMQLPSEPATDRPLVVQFCANDAQLLLKAAKHVEHLADAVDINLGCPQGIAKRGHYGSFLLEETQLLHDMVSTLHQNLRIPVTCKIRRLPESAGGDEATIALVKMLEEAGAALITVHGRSRLQNKDSVGACDWDLIRLVKQNARVPVLANGGIADQDDVERCLAYTGVDGVMSSEALLCNPTLFSGQRKDSRAVAREYLAICRDLMEAQGVETDQAAIRAHLFKIVYPHLQLHTDIRDRLAHCKPDEFDAVMDELDARFVGLTEEEQAAQLATVPVWYRRHWKTEAQIAEQERRAAEKAAQRQAALNDVDDGLPSIFDEEACTGCA